MSLGKRIYLVSNDTYLHDFICDPNNASCKNDFLVKNSRMILINPANLFLNPIYYYLLNGIFFHIPHHIYPLYLFFSLAQAVLYLE